MDDLTLASEFPRPTRDAWLALVARVLKGGDFDRTLVGASHDGIRIEPLYQKAAGSSSGPARAPAPPRLAARVDHPESDVANALALADLEGGADALTLVGAASGGARGFGISFDDVDALDRTLAGVDLSLIQVRIEAGAKGREAADAILALIARRGLGLDALDLDLGLDPIGAAARSGAFAAPWPTVADRLAARLDIVGSQGFAGRLALADGRPYAEGGAGEAQELAAALATALAYLRALESGGHDLAAARDAISFTLTVDSDVLMTVAKLRAARRLWAEIEAACGLPPAPIRLHAETGWRMMTRRDPHVNLLRGTLACFAAAIGGADGVTVLPFTSALGLPDAFARRLARNTQVVLQEEANLWRVGDPVAGSGAFEALTDEIAESAWASFRDLERDGGIVASLAAGGLQGRIAETRARRDAAIATRRDPIIGVSEFPHLDEETIAVLRPAVGPAAVRRDAAFTAIPSCRSAEPFERLRDRSDAVLAATGRRPIVFLATLGPVASHAARLAFAKAAFATCGIEASGHEDGADVETLAGRFRASGARTACLCGSDETYARDAIAAAAALTAAGAAPLYLAGRPGGMASALAAAGLTAYLHLGSDIPSTLDGAVA